MSSNIDTKKIHNTLSQIQHPELGITLEKSGYLRELSLDDNNDLQIHCQLLSAADPSRDLLESEISQALKDTHPELSSHFHYTIQQSSTQTPLANEVSKKFKNLIVVASGKGGVGKSTVACNLAASLASCGSKVGLLDADVYGPSIPALLQITEPPRIKDRKMLPVYKYGMEIMSMGLLMKPEESVVWRGPMLHGAIRQFLQDVAWSDLDYLVVDMPPGTGDIALSFSQLAPIGGAVIVSSPQQVALGIATKAISMFEKLNVPVIGMVENMSYYSCPHCQQRDDVFGHGGAQKVAEEIQIPFLGSIPLNSLLREAGDQGTPLVVSHPESIPAIALHKAARLAAGRMSVAAELGYEHLSSNTLKPEQLSDTVQKLEQSELAAKD